MARNLRILCCVAVAVGAVSAVQASGASATNYTSASATTWWHGAQTTSSHVFTVNSRTMKCSNTTFSSESTGTSVSSLTITPTYSGCEAFGVSEAEGSKVTMNGCTFILTPISKTKALMVIQCPVGKEVTIDIGKDICLVHIAPQSPGEKIDLVVGGGDVVHKATVDNVTSTVTYGAEGSLLLCGASGTRTLSYTGEVQMGGYKNAALTEETTVGVE